MNKLKNHYFSLLGIIVITLVAFRNLPNSFFEQDEWHSFGHYIYLTSLPFGDFWGNALRSGPFSHFTPFALFFKMSLYQLFGLNAEPYFIISIFLHILVSLSVYFLIFLLLKQKLPAFLGSIFFAINSNHHQAVTWLGTFEGVTGATLFGILTIISLIIYKQNFNIKLFYLSLVFIFVALLFKEISLTFFLVQAGIILSLKREKWSKLILLGSVFGFYAILRFSYLLFGKETIVGSAVENKINLIGLLAHNLLIVPLKIFSLILLPQNLLNTLESRSILLGQYFPDFFSLSGLFINELNFYFEALLILFGILILIISLTLVRVYSKPVYFGISLVFLTVVPLLFLRKYLVIIDSRFFYPATVGVSIIIAVLFSLILKNLSLKKGATSKKFIPLALFLILFLFHLKSLTSIINQKVAEGVERKKILTEIKTLYPKLDNQAIFLAQSDNFYYGIPERILPFQSGFGQILLVNYRQEQYIPAQFFTDEFLWDITSEEYKQLDNFGFGYFKNFDTLAKSICKNKIDHTSVFAFSYISKEKKIIDITRQTRNEIVGFAARKIELDLREANVNFSPNPAHGFLALDGKRETYWSSKIPYAIKHQYFEVDFEREVKIAQIKLDSYDNKDQNEVGYAVSLSENGKDWTEVLRTVRRTPRQDGIVDIYLPKTKTRFLRVEQIGEHGYAPWVIHELKIYAAVN